MTLPHPHAADLLWQQRGRVVAKDPLSTPSATTAAALLRNAPPSRASGTGTFGPICYIIALLASSLSYDCESIPKTQDSFQRSSPQPELAVQETSVPSPVDHPHHQHLPALSRPLTRLLMSARSSSSGTQHPLR
ncbi:hypothetical protein XANCAGTX0491_001744 [Xanthoria calcicola]